MLQQLRQALRAVQGKRIFSSPLTRSFFSQGERNFFKPSQNLAFKQGYLQLFNYSKINAARFSFFVVSGMFGFLGFYSLAKLYHHEDRTIMGMILFAGLAYFSISRVIRSEKLLSSIILKLELRNCGKRVKITTPSRIFFTQVKKFDITQIKKPLDADIEHVLNERFAFPIIMNNNLYYFIKDGEIKQNKPILNAVLNGEIIDTSPKIVEQIEESSNPTDTQTEDPAKVEKIQTIE